MRICAPCRENATAVQQADAAVAGSCIEPSAFAPVTSLDEVRSGREPDQSVPCRCARVLADASLHAPAGATIFAFSATNFAGRKTQICDFASLRSRLRSPPKNQQARRHTTLTSIAGWGKEWALDVGGRDSGSHSMLWITRRKTVDYVWRLATPQGFCVRAVCGM